MKKYLRFFVIALVLLLFIGMFVFLWQNSRPKPVVYEEFTPAVMDLRRTTVVTGKIEPRNEVNVKPQISGIITEILKALNLFQKIYIHFVQYQQITLFLIQSFGS